MVISPMRRLIISNTSLCASKDTFHCPDSSNSMWRALSHSSWQVNMNKVEQSSDSIYIYIFKWYNVKSIFYPGPVRAKDGPWWVENLGICSLL